MPRAGLQASLPATPAAEQDGPHQPPDRGRLPSLGLTIPLSVSHVAVSSLELLLLMTAELSAWNHSLLFGRYCGGF